MSAARFENILAPLTEGARKTRIRDALVSSNIESEEDLKDIVGSRNVESATDLLQRNLNINELDASALAGVVIQHQVIASPGKLISFPPPLLCLSLLHSLSHSL